MTATFKSDPGLTLGPVLEFHPQMSIESIGGFFDPTGRVNPTCTEGVYPIWLGNASGKPGKLLSTWLGKAQEARGDRQLI